MLLTFDILGGMAKKRAKQERGEPLNAVVAFTNTAYRGEAAALDINELIVKNPHSTFFMRVEGDSWTQYGIEDGDVVVIDKSLKPKRTDTIAAVKDGEFVLANLNTDDDGEIEAWGVITYVVHRRRK